MGESGEGGVVELEGGDDSAGGGAATSSRGMALSSSWVQGLVRCLISSRMRATNSTGM